MSVPVRPASKALEILALVFLLALVFVPAGAHEPVAAQTLERQALDQARTLDTIHVTGGPRPLSRFPGAVSIVEGAALHDGQRQVNLSEPLQRVPGVTALERQNYAQDLQIQSRGFGARSTFGIRGIRLVVDGIPSSAADGQGQAAAFPLASLDRVEVLRGPLALQYGNAAGGVILGVSELEAVSSIAMDAWASSDGSERLGLRADGSTPDGAWRWRAAASAFATDGARPHSAARRRQLNAISEWSPRDGERLRVVYNGLRQPLAEDPLGLTRAAFTDNPDATDPAATLFDTRKSVREDQLGVGWWRDMAGRGEIRLSAYRVSRDIEQFLAVPVAAQRALGSAGGVIDLGRGSTGVDLSRRWRGAQGALTVGIEGVRLDETRRGYENFVGERLGVRGRLRRDERNRVVLLDLYAVGEYGFADGWNALLGTRRSHLRIDSRDRYFDNGDDSGGSDDRQWATSFGVVREFAHGEGYISLGRGFETPTLTELAYRPDGAAGFNRDLRAAHTRAIELGARWRGGWGDASLVVYRVAGEDEIVPALNRSGRASFANTGATRRDGIEFGMSGDVGARWRYALAASWIDARFVEGFDFIAQGESRVVEAGNRIPGIPRADLFAECAWRSGDHHWTSAFEARVLGGIVTDDRNADAAAGNARFAWRGEWRALGHGTDRGGWHGFVRIDNLFDRRYAGSVIVNEGSGRYFEPGAGRSMTVGIGWSGRRESPL